MEVLRHGNTYKEIECDKCGALLSYCESDIKKDHTSKCYSGEISRTCKTYVTCPECHKMITLSLVVNGEEMVKK